MVRLTTQISQALLLCVAVIVESQVSILPSATEEICKSSPEIKTVKCTNANNTDRVAWNISTVPPLPQLCVCSVYNNSSPCQPCNELDQGALIINLTSITDEAISSTVYINVSQIQENFMALEISCSNSTTGKVEMPYMLNLKGPGLPNITGIECDLGEVTFNWTMPKCCSSFIVKMVTLIEGSNNITNTSENNQTSMTFTTKEFHQRSAVYVSIACKDANNMTGPFSSEFEYYINPECQMMQMTQSDQVVTGLGVALFFALVIVIVLGVAVIILAVFIHKKQKEN